MVSIHPQPSDELGWLQRLPNILSAERTPLDYTYMVHILLCVNAVFWKNGKVTYSRARLKAVLNAPFSHVSKNLKQFPSGPTCSSYQPWGPFSSHRPVRTTTGSYSPCLIWLSHFEANIEERGERQLLMQPEGLRAKTALQWPHLRRAKKRNLIKWPGLSIAPVHWDHWCTLILYISKIWFPHGHFAQAYWASAQQREASSTQAFHNFWVWAFTSFSFENLLTPRDAKNALKLLRQELSYILPILDSHAEPA